MYKFPNNIQKNQQMHLAIKFFRIQQSHLTAVKTNRSGGVMNEKKITVAFQLKSRVNQLISLIKN